MSNGGGGRELTADELDRLQRRLLGKAVAIILSPDWGRKSERPIDGQGGQDAKK